MNRRMMERKRYGEGRKMAHHPKHTTSSVKHGGSSVTRKISAEKREMLVDLHKSGIRY